VHEPIRWQGQVVEILDQRRLPWSVRYIRCRGPMQVVSCIKTLAVRGAPAIGVAGAMGVALAARGVRCRDPERFVSRLTQRVQPIAEARPTAVNLAWAVERMLAAARKIAHLPAEQRFGLLKQASQQLLKQEVAACQEMGRHGAELLPERARVLTHCNAGALATGGYGTALGVIRAAVEMGKQIEVIADETRPLLQGARLTAWEMVADGIPVKVIPDGAAAMIIARGGVDAVVVGADRIAANGDVANKIGTYAVALAARAHGVAFYVAAPTSTLDLNCPSGQHIPIEERDPEEVHSVAGRRITPQGAGAINLAFDVTPAELVSAIITEQGVARAPYEHSLAEMVARATRAGRS